MFAGAKTDREGILSLRDAGPAVVGGKGRAKDVPVPDSEEVVLSRVTRRGAHSALARLAELFGPRLFEDVPKVWDCISSAVAATLGSAFSFWPLPSNACARED